MSNEEMASMKFCVQLMDFMDCGQLISSIDICDCRLVDLQESTKYSLITQTIVRTYFEVMHDYYFIVKKKLKKSEKKNFN